VARHALGLVATLLATDDWERSAGYRLARDGVFRHIQAVCGDAAQTLREQLRSVAAHPETRAAAIASLRELPRSRALDDPDRLATVACPALIVAAHSDPLHPFECARELADALPNSRLVPIATGPDDRSSTEEAARAVGEFLRAVQDGREHARQLATLRRARRRTSDPRAPSVL
jgi:pimeloyl-ACP methyl ester carboxylesterase